jgi:predicted nucleic acid-binding protein
VNERDEVEAKALLETLAEVTGDSVTIDEITVSTVVHFFERAKATALREAADLLEERADAGDPTGGEDYYWFGPRALGNAAEMVRDMAAKLEGGTDGL